MFSMVLVCHMDVLCPLLFRSYVNNLPAHMNNSKAVLFTADVYCNAWWKRTRLYYEMGANLAMQFVNLLWTNKSLICHNPCLE